MLRGIYLTHSGTPSNDDWARAALLFARSPDAVLSGSAGLHRLGLSGPYPGPRLLVLVPSGCSRQSVGPIAIRHAHHLPRRIITYPRIPVATVERCVVDACLDSMDLGAVRHSVASAVQSGRCFIEDLIEESARVTARGAGALRKALAEVADGARSVAECEAAELMFSAGLPRCRQNVDVLDAAGRWLACADFYWEELGAILEVDSRDWHLDPESWQETLMRHNRLEAAGFTVMHCTPSQIRRNPDAVVRQIRAWLQARARSIPA